MNGPGARSPDPPAILDDPLRGRSHPWSLWSSTNVAEAIPGVMTPLSFSLWQEATDRGTRATFQSVGAARKNEVALPDRDEDRVLSAFFGRAALRVDFMCEMVNRMPGVSATAMAEQVFSAVPAGFVDKPRRRYYPLVALRFPITAAGVPRRVRAAQESTSQAWRTEIPLLAHAGTTEALACFRRARERHNHNILLAGLSLFCVAQPVADQLRVLLARAGGADPDLTGGYGNHEESKLVADLWKCSRGQLELAGFIALHGYHGPREGELSSLTWREDPRPLNRILDGYRAMYDTTEPERAEHERAHRREAAERRLLAAMPALRRPQARAVMTLARRVLPLRGKAKVAFLQSFDLARASARRLGECLVADGVFTDPDDIFFLTAEEMSASNWAGADIAARRAAHSWYQHLELPGTWTGIPEPREIATSHESDRHTLQGTGVSGGVVEGRVRVVTEPGDGDLSNGEILVAHVTDPSWASILFLSSALVIDVGGMLSHAAVVARELGIPCVANTKIGTKVLRNGDRCRVDGTTGTVEVLNRADLHTGVDAPREAIT